MPERLKSPIKYAMMGNIPELFKETPENKKDLLQLRVTVQSYFKNQKRGAERLSKKNSDKQLLISLSKKFLKQNLATENQVWFELVKNYIAIHDYNVKLETPEDYHNISFNRKLLAADIFADSILEKAKNNDGCSIASFFFFFLLPSHGNFF